MDFVISYSNLGVFKETIKVTDNLYLFYESNHKIKDKECVINNDAFFFAIEANVSLIQSINQAALNPLYIEQLANKLENGFLLYINKSENSISLFTDIYGFSHVFIFRKEASLFISNNFQTIVPFSKGALDPFAALDMYLFNYTLADRTLVSDIKRITGGQKIVIKNKSIAIDIPNNFAANYKIPTKEKKINVNEFGEILSKSVYNEISSNVGTNLAITAGFDSRALLAATVKKNIKVSAFTFGQKGNIEVKTILPFIHKFSKSYDFIELDQTYIDNINNTVDQFIDNTLDCPTILDLPHYYYIRSLLGTSNIINGFMGGELMIGQSLGAQVTFTEFASKLLLSEDIESLRNIFRFETRKFHLFNENFIQELETDYLTSLSQYFKGTDNSNILRFLINEKYSKFFGTINKVFHNHSNVIVPLMSKEIAEYILDSEISFLKKEPFRNNPITNIHGKTFYAKVIRELAPELGETRFDRLYKVNDLCYKYRLPFAALGYLRSHILKTNKKFPKPHNYFHWYENLVIESLSNINQNYDVFNLDFKISSTTYNQFSLLEKKAYTNIIATIISYEKIKSIPGNG